MNVSVREGIETASGCIEILAVVLMCALIAAETGHWLVQIIRRNPEAHGRYRAAIGKSLLIGLELLVAADIISTVALGTTLVNLMILGVLVILRTFLSWTLSLEVEGRWPWQERRTETEAQSHSPTKE